MGRTTIYSNLNDAFLRSSSTNVLNAQSGNTGASEAPAFIEAVGGTELHFGQKFERSNGGTYVTEAFQEFVYTPAPSTHLVTTAAYKIRPARLPSGDQWDAEIREYDWGGTVTTADWVTGPELRELPLLGHFPEIRTKRPAPGTWRSGIDTLRARVTQSSPLRVVLNSNKVWLGYHAGGNGDEWLALGSFEGATAPYRPQIEFSTIQRSSLTRVLGASVQLTDGTVAYLMATGDVLTLHHKTAAGSTQTVATLSVGLGINQFALQPGGQAFTLTRDAADNLYVVGPAGAILQGVTAQAFAKGAGYSWAPRTALTTQLAYYDEPLNQTAATWHQVTGSTRGYLAVVAAHTQGHSHGNQTLLLSLRCDSLLAGAGTLLADQKDVTTASLGAPINATGNGLDVLAVDGGRGILAGITFDHGAPTWSEENGRVSAYRYVIGTGGKFSTAPTRVYNQTTNGAVTADGEIRARLVRVSASRFVLVAGAHIVAFTYSGDTVTTNSSIRNLAAAGMTTFGTAGTTQCDALYDAAANRVWIYYLDAGNSRRVMRTGFNVGSSLLTLEQIQVATNTGPSGSSNLMLRVPRGAIDERTVHVHLANLAGDGTTHSLVQLDDTGLNQAPAAPLLGPVDTFNAAASKRVTWTYSDPNPHDRQSAYQLQVRNQATSTLVYDSTKVVTPTGTQSFTISPGTLSNTTTYEWRVRTWDTSDVVGPYSAYSSFTTAATGIVEITMPGEDNPPGLASPTLDVAWTFSAASGATQARYRVNVLRVDSGVSLFDSGYISSSDARSYTVRGLISNVEQQVEVRIEDSTGLLSNTASRRITPVFAGPDAPMLLVQPTADESGIEIQVTNPDPTGDLPSASRNEVFRAPTGTGDFIKIGDVFPNDTFTDYAVASGELYDYMVRAVAEGETDSDVVSGVSVTFYGVYIHDPLDPGGTIRHLPYGGASKSEEVASAATRLDFIGRPLPVFEFGEHLAESVAVGVQVYYNEERGRVDLEYLRNVARSRRVHCYRDGRGRKVFGVATGASIKDIPADGHDVQLTVTRADYTEELS